MSETKENNTQNEKNPQADAINENKKEESKTSEKTEEKKKYELKVPEKKEPKWFQNKQLRDYGIFLLILTVMFSLISLFVFTNRNTWNKGLSEQIKIVMEKNNYKNVEVSKEPVTINSALSTSCAAYGISYEGSSKDSTAVIVRITTLYGPAAAVYVYNGAKTEFIDFTSSERITEKQNISISKNMQIDYWKKRIPTILPETALKTGEETK